MILAGDIGGTKTYLALYDWKEDRVEPTREEKFYNSDFESFEEILSEFLEPPEDLSDLDEIVGEPDKDSATNTSASENEKLGRLVIDLGSILEGSNEDIILEDGDFLHIPPIQQVISVVGEVFVPTSHSYASDLSIDDYISLSGGINPYADQNNIYLIKADGSMISPSQLTTSGFFKRNSQGLEPGDSIVVPLEVQPFSGIRATTCLLYTSPSPRDRG